MAWDTHYFGYGSKYKYFMWYFLTRFVTRKSVYQNQQPSSAKLIKSFLASRRSIIVAGKGWWLSSKACIQDWMMPNHASTYCDLPCMVAKHILAKIEHVWILKLNKFCCTYCTSRWPHCTPINVALVRIAATIGPLNGLIAWYDCAEVGSTWHKR